MEILIRNPKIFLIAGKARHGKDTVAQMIIEEYQKNNKKGLNLSLGSYIKMYAQKITDWDGNEETKPREVLQQLGTEIIRKKLITYFSLTEFVKISKFIHIFLIF